MFKAKNGKAAEKAVPKPLAKVITLLSKASGRQHTKDNIHTVTVSNDGERQRGFMPIYWQPDDTRPRNSK